VIDAAAARRVSYRVILAQPYEVHRVECRTPAQALLDLVAAQLKQNHPDCGLFALLDRKQPKRFMTLAPLERQPTRSRTLTASLARCRSTAQFLAKRPAARLGSGGRPGVDEIRLGELAPQHRTGRHTRRRRTPHC